MEKGLVYIAVLYAIDIFNRVFGIQNTFEKIFRSLKKPKFTTDYTYYQNGKQYQIVRVELNFFIYEYGICDITTTGKQSSSQRFFGINEDFILKEYEIPEGSSLEKALK